MEFRWAVWIALWTFLIGPIWATPPRQHAAEGKTAATSAAQRPAIAKIGVQIGTEFRAAGCRHSDAGDDIRGDDERGTTTRSGSTV